MAFYTFFWYAGTCSCHIFFDESICSCSVTATISQENSLRCTYEKCLDYLWSCFHQCMGMAFICIHHYFFLKFLTDLGSIWYFSEPLFYFKRTFVQVNLFQKHLFLHQLTHNMTKDCSLNYKFRTGKLQAQYYTCNVHKLLCRGKQKNNLCTELVNFKYILNL